MLNYERVREFAVKMLLARMQASSFRNYVTDRMLQELPELKGDAPGICVGDVRSLADRAVDEMIAQLRSLLPDGER